MSGSTTGARLAPLKPDLGPEKRAFAEDLRRLFLTLDVSVRRYAVRRHLDPSTVTRYLSGERVPPWDFVAGVVGDAAEELAHPLTAEAEAALRELHRAALKASRRNTEVQQLQDRLADADEEIRRIKTRQRALEDSLRDRHRRLSDIQRRCLHAEEVVEKQRLIHSAELERWKGEYERLDTERDDLCEQVLFLEEALTVARAELIAAEEECCRLENELENVQEDLARVAAPSLMEALEATDRTATVAELVDLVGGLETRTQHAIASELVTSVSRTRAITEVCALLSGLYGAGLHHHAEAALPALVMMRPVDDVAGLVASMVETRLHDPLVTVLQASVRLHTPQDIALLAGMLRSAGLCGQAASLLGAAAVTREIPEVVAAVGCLAEPGGEPLVEAGLAAAARYRPVRDVVQLLDLLRHAGHGHLAPAMARALATRRRAPDIAEFIGTALRSGWEALVRAALDHSEQRELAHVVELVHALLRTGHPDIADGVLLRAVGSRPPAEVAALIADLHASASTHLCARALGAALRGLCATGVRELITELHRAGADVDAMLKSTTRVCTPGDAATVFATLEACGLGDIAETVFQCVIATRATSHAGLFLQGLRVYGAPALTIAALQRRARDSSVLALAQLVRALDAPSLGPQLGVALETCATARSSTDLTILLKHLREEASASPRTHHVIGLLLQEVVLHRGVAEQVDLHLALDAAGLPEQALRIQGLAARSERAADFTRLLRERGREHEQRPLSRSFWRTKRP
ncbi:hypothetical protein ACIOUE_29035 [Streptomyces xanthochromogenes]|uniref:hypothetical protein n=1 Tax=Streptomyces xanthochromogenes TaxID=67384 RepID=UPI00381F4FE2